MDGDAKTGRDTSIAAALHALAPGSDPDLFPMDEHVPLMSLADTQMVSAMDEASEADRAVFDACRQLAMAGTRPRTRMVIAYLKDRTGVLRTREDVTPLIRQWKAAQWKSTEVRSVFQAYARLDAEQRAAFRMRAEVDDSTLGVITTSVEGQPPPAFQIRIQYRGGQVRHEPAERATIAWVKFQNLVDRQPPDVARLELLENTPQGTRTLRKWRVGAPDITSWTA